MTDTAEEVLGKHRRRTKPWVTDQILEMCDKRREAKKKKDTTEGRKEYAKMNRDIRKDMKTANQKWIEDQFKEIEEDLQNNNTKKHFRKSRPSQKTKKALHPLSKQRTVQYSPKRKISISDGLNTVKNCITSGKQETQQC